MGRPAGDALTIAPRICGICSVSQSMAAAAVLRALCGVQPPRNGELAANLVHAAENIADHLSHFYLFFMPDFARAEYAGKPWHGEIAARFKAVEGSRRARNAPGARAAPAHHGADRRQMAAFPGLAAGRRHPRASISAEKCGCWRFWAISAPSPNKTCSARRWSRSPRWRRRSNCGPMPSATAISPPFCASPATCGWMNSAAAPCR